MGRDRDARLAVGVLAVGVALAAVLIGSGTSAFAGLLVAIVAIVLAGLLATGRLG